jgi:hypothetical protein
MVSYTSLSVALGFLLTCVLTLLRTPTSASVVSLASRLAPSYYDLGRGIVLSCLVEIAKTFVKYLFV